MEKLTNYLRQTLREEMPDWLKMEKEWRSFPREAFFGSRVVYYPGSGTDGHPVRVFGSTYAAHCFVYVDYRVTRAELERELGDDRDRFRGYRTVSRLSVREDELVPQGWKAHIELSEAKRALRNHFARVLRSPYGFMDILEREEGLEEEHGPKRLAALFLGADGIASYDALFCQENGIPAPFAALLHDHGFGGNYDKFGCDGLMEGVAIRCNVFPKWLLVAENTKAWGGYARVPDVRGSNGGTHYSERRLYSRSER